MYYVLDDENKVVGEPSVEAWAQWFEDNGLNERRRVGEDRVGQMRVSTVFLGIDHNFGSGPPHVFETMVFPSEDDYGEVFSLRYSTWEEAEVGHRVALDWATRWKADART